jgi:hypothetical protein
MSELELEGMNLRLSRGEELRLGLLLAALRAGWVPLKLGRPRKAVGEARRRQQPDRDAEPLAA